MKKIFTLFSLMGISVMATADTFMTADELVYDYDTEAKTASIYGTRISGRKIYHYQGTSLNVTKTVIINEEPYNVIKIGSFDSSPNLETIVVPEGVELSVNSFNGCEKLKNIRLPEGMTYIPAGCFSGTAITDLSFLPSTIETVGTIDHNLAISLAPGVFGNCLQLKNVTLPVSVKYIGTNTFSDCTNLSHVTLHEGIVLIGRGTFSRCTSLESVTIPSTVTTLGSNLFARDTNLKSVTMPDGISFIGKSAFEYTSLTEITLPLDLESIRMGLFNNTPIESLSIPAKVMRIIPAGLARMNELKTLTIIDSPNTLDFDLTANHRFGRDPWPDEDTQETDAIGSWLYGTTGIQQLYIGRNIATWIHPDYEFPTDTRSNEEITNPFYSMESLESVTIGPQVTDASQLLFQNYANLREINLLCATPPTLNPLTPQQAVSVKVTVPEGTLDAYRNVEGWNNIVNLEETTSVNIVTDETIINTQLYNLQGTSVNDSYVGPVIMVSTHKDGHITVKKILK
ncbi:MAG: leucine-rich repeat domain-containing protein [Muribaculaceae bacterium]|nr:leucine-rich repeat domain-containing protein [Muribaculaceae bacterium]